MDLFQKCYDFTRADEVKAAGLYPYFRPIQQNDGPVVIMEGRRVIMCGSNNYLGLTAHPKVKEAAINAIKKYGSGCSGSRYLNGTLEIHVELENKLSEFFQREDCLIFSTGYQTAQGIIPTLVQKGEYVVTDKDNHASIVAGYLMARGLSADFVRYKHNDMEDLERVISQIPLDVPKLVVSDGIFSSSGTIVNLPDLVKVAKKYNARILIDDAHAVGIIGVGGRGTASHFNLVKETDMTFGTFSKTFASLGGFVVGDHKVINYIRHFATSLIFAASPTPAATAAALAALEVLKAEPERITRLHANARKMREGFKSIGFNIIPGDSAVVPIIVGDDVLALTFTMELYRAGVFVNAFIRPVVQPGMQMVRTSYMATHEESHLDEALEIFKTVGKKLGVIG
ncbi:MAG: pyridoxal phosphate-dependent aminotransferase family protein [Bacteroidota bacterium]